MKRVLMPTGQRDFDPTEVAIAWKILKNQGLEVIFASPDGQQAQADPLMLSGEGLDPWGWIPGLKRVKALGLILRAQTSTRQAYAALCEDSQFQTPLSYAELAPERVAEFDGLYLPGGHAKGMKSYLESTELQHFVGHFSTLQTRLLRPKPLLPSAMAWCWPPAHALSVRGVRCFMAVRPPL